MLKKMVSFGFILFASISLLTGCSTTEKSEKPKVDLPMWVLNPVIEGGIAASECVVYTGDIGIDKAEAVALGRASLAKQIEVKVKAMDKTYQRKVKSKKGIAVGGVFETVSKQIAKRDLQGARAIKFDVINVGGKDQLCVMVALDPTLTEKLFKNLVKESGADLNAQDESALYEEFKAYKAQQELDAEMEKM